VGSQLGVTEEKIDALPNYAESELYNDAERAALEFADSMTITGRDVTDELFQRVQKFFNEDAIVELTATIAWENASSKFNRALRVPSQQLRKRNS
jgi:alkylhydroperoxidase family enzyme